MPPKRKTKNESTPAGWLDKFCRAENIPDEVKEILFDWQITSKATFSALTGAGVSNQPMKTNQ